MKPRTSLTILLMWAVAAGVLGVRGCQRRMDCEERGGMMIRGTWSDVCVRVEPLPKE